MSALVICCIHFLALLTYVSIEASSVHPDQTAPTTFKTFQQPTKHNIYCDWRFKG